ncbi:MAG: ATP-dependent Clp protease adapter ClpS [Candidatus Oxydemutatoraceae bacterium WSBS_2016_MAG_OTU14]
MTKTSTVTKQSQKTQITNQKPPMYCVFILNDDYTPMDFVVQVLKQFFSMNDNDAHQLMMTVHSTGAGICGIFPHEIAEMRVSQVMNCAKKNNHPLRCTMKAEEISS